MSWRSRIAIALAALLLAVWFIANYVSLSADTDTMVRLILGAIVAILLVARPKADVNHLRIPWWVVPAVAVAGTLLAVVGEVSHINQFRWIGFLLLLFAILEWGMSGAASKDILAAVLIFYWAHSLPGQIIAPLQIGMQKLSVAGAGWVLHCANVRVWADEMVLRTGLRTFDVPEACSGMKTAATVLLCALGSGVLFRFKWHSILLLVLLGMAQVLALNILRISGMVFFGKTMPQQWADDFLHDTTGVFLLASIALIQLEAAAFSAIRAKRRMRVQAIREGKIETEDRGSILNLPLQNALRALKIAAIALPVVLLGAALVYKSRPHHRAVMISGAAEALARNDLESAEKAAIAAQRLRPDNLDFTIQRIEILLLRTKFAEAQELLDSIKLKNRGTFHRILSAWVAIGMNKPDEAMALVSGIPCDPSSFPGIAIVKAEVAAIHNNLHEVIANIVAPARHHLFVHRARALFPYLAAHEQWRTIAACGSDIPHRDLNQVIAAIHAAIRMNDIHAAGILLEQALNRWPGETRLVEYLAALAMARPGGRWEQLFADRLISALPLMSADQLASQMESSFRLYRPELAWAVYNRLSELDPSDPSLLLVPAQFHNRWFLFRKHKVGVASPSQNDLIDMRFYYMKRAVDLNIPLAREITESDARSFRESMIARCIEELDRRKADNAITLRMWFIYPSALELAGRYKEAHVFLDDIEKRFPGQRTEALFRHAILYNSQEDWINLYEALREISLSSRNPSLPVALMQINALMHLDMSVYALTLAQHAIENLPSTPQLLQSTAAILVAHGLSEEALFLLTRDNTFPPSPFLAELLDQTERYSEANDIRRSLGISPRPTELMRQRLVLPYAEKVMLPAIGEPLSNMEMDALAAQSEADADESSNSPYICGIRRLLAGWYRNRGLSGFSAPEKWMEVGRDDTEKAMALHRLALLLWRQNRTNDAFVAADKAATLSPKAAMLWRVRQGLAGNDWDGIRKAHANCPNDPILWLNYMTSAHKEGRDADWFDKEAQLVVAKDLYPVPEIVMAGDFLMRNGMLEPASRLARHAISKSKSFIPPYVLGMRCAIARNDTPWATVCASTAADIALDPWPFLKLLAYLKTSARAFDADAISILERLHANDSKDNYARSLLGDAYLMKGETKRAYALLQSYAAVDPRKLSIHTLLATAESARRAGETETCIAILESAHATYPSDTNILNNLIHSLALQKRGLNRAIKLLPKLLNSWKDSFVPYDTAALVYAASGDIAKASESLRKAISMLDATEPAWFSVNPEAFDGEVYSKLVSDRDGGITPAGTELLRLVRDMQKKIRSKTFVTTLPKRP